MAKGTQAKSAPKPVRSASTQPATGANILPPRPPCEVELVSTAPTADNLLDVAFSGLDTSTHGAWLPVAQCPVHASLDVWLSVMAELIEHPERNSSSILRADILTAEGEALHWQPAAKDDSSTQADAAYQRYRSVHRRLLPRRPTIDWPMEQLCTFYTRKRPATATATPLRDALIVYTPFISRAGTTTIGEARTAGPGPQPSTSQEPLRPPDKAEQIPFYHPHIRAIAFEYQACEPQQLDAAASTSSSAPTLGTLRLSIIAFDSTPMPLPADHRLARTAIALLKIQHAHSWGTAHSYVKRVEHDVVVAREAYLDTYLSLKTKHAERLIASWVEATDPAKHVFEDIGIAAWLMCLWRDMYPRREGESSEVESPWKAWGRPKGGFVDVGCGNGLLVHLLNAEGYQGYGVDLRARKSWPVHTAAPGGADLREASLDVPSLVLNAATEPPFPADSFLVGNHSDELTPWMPLLAAVTPGAAAFVSIPCCFWELEGSKFTRGRYRLSDEELHLYLGTPSAPDAQRVVADTLSTLARGPSVAGSAVTVATSSSRNIAYLTYIAAWHLRAGWHLEKEALRIPSTKNWALLGRRRTWQRQWGLEADEGVDKTWAEGIRRAVMDRILLDAKAAQPRWVARVPEGNAGKAATH